MHFSPSKRSRSRGKSCLTIRILRLSNGKHLTGTEADDSWTKRHESEQKRTIREPKNTNRNKKGRFVNQKTPIGTETDDSWIKKHESEQKRAIRESKDTNRNKNGRFVNQKRPIWAETENSGPKISEISSWEVNCASKNWNWRQTDLLWSHFPGLRGKTLLCRSKTGPTAKLRPKGRSKDGPGI